MWRILTIGLLLLAACGGGGGATPEQVLLERDRVTIRLSNGWPCVGFRSEGTVTETGWSGQLAGCPVSYPYAVHLENGTRPRRQELVLAGKGAGPTVVIEGGGGRNWIFGTP
ncbi:hypothetical protein [Actibacterium ureilyticum]|uniref:hypothetical protein n=1 Tax=Actibacterium ureilyticum TaxID=1590614 RepID=UPI000BAAB9FE|nr:hypothetical protein [Actibacterium ureilyticum]